MTERILTIDEAGRSFAELVERVRRDGESAVLTDNGVAVARLVPIGAARTALEAADGWERRPRLDPEDAEAFERDIEIGPPDAAPEPRYRPPSCAVLKC